MNELDLALYRHKDTIEHAEYRLIYEAATRYAKLEPLLAELVEAREEMGETRITLFTTEGGAHAVQTNGGFNVEDAANLYNFVSAATKFIKAANLTPQIKQIIGGE